MEQVIPAPQSADADCYIKNVSQIKHIYFFQSFKSAQNKIRREKHRKEQDI